MTPTHQPFMGPLGVGGLEGTHFWVNFGVQDGGTSPPQAHPRGPTPIRLGPSRSQNHPLPESQTLENPCSKPNPSFVPFRFAHDISDKILPCREWLGKMPRRGEEEGQMRYGKFLGPTMEASNPGTGMGEGTLEPQRVWLLGRGFAAKTEADWSVIDGVWRKPKPATRNLIKTPGSGQPAEKKVLAKDQGGSRGWGRTVWEGLGGGGPGRWGADPPTVAPPKELRRHRR